MDNTTVINAKYCRAVHRLIRHSLHSLHSY